jgi:hypothetical protein
MKIACLGWGSLIWNSGTLKVTSNWNSDGPSLPVEFARESQDGRMTLVLCDDIDTTPTFWVLMQAEDIQTAKVDLANREGITDKNIQYSVGYWDSNSGKSNGKYVKEISKWAKEKGLDGVVWTNLKYGFKESRDSMPTIDKVIEHFSKLPTEAKIKAEEYVRKAPKQIRTEFRNVLEKHFNWYPIP